jgi:hypothetical protein
MTDITQKRAELQPADLDRMRCLAAEVRARLDEMAQITAGTLGIGLDDEAVVKFVPLPAQHDDPPGMTIEIICGPDGCACYVDPPGICEFPCGAAGPL